MKRTIIFALLMSTFFIQIRCMNEQQKLLNSNGGSSNGFFSLVTYLSSRLGGGQQPTNANNYTAPSAPPVYGTLPAYNNNDIERGRFPSINNNQQQPIRTAWPQEADTFDPKTGDTFGQFWDTHQVPDNVKKWTRKAQIDWVAKQEWDKRCKNCKECCCSKNAQCIYWTVAGMACCAGAITGLVYAVDEIAWDYDWDIDPNPPDFQTRAETYSQSFSQSLSNYTFGNNTDHND